MTPRNDELSRREFLSTAATMAALLALGDAHEAEAASAPAGGGSLRALTPAAPAETYAPVDKAAMREAVRQGCLRAWNGYKKYAWGCDALNPLSKGGHNWYPVSLVMTPVDAFDTLSLMGLNAQAHEAKQLILDKLKFDVDNDVSVFEMSFRLLGGLLSAYEIDGDPRFLALARELADRMAPAYDTPTGMPYRFVNLHTGKCHDAVCSSSESGTGILEYGTLSKHTGDPKYLVRARKALDAVYSRRSKLDLMGQSINVETGAWVNPDSSVLFIDAFVESLPKGALLFRDPTLTQKWETCHAAINRYLADTREGRLWYGHADMNIGQRTGTDYGSLHAYYAAVLALGGDLEHAKQLQDSNFFMWQLAGVEPEYFNYASKSIIAPWYDLRPEVLESNYYLYHFTHDEKYLRMGKIMFDSIENYCGTETGYATLKDVNTKEKEDQMDGYFLAETLKYAFLLFDDGKALDFDKVIFNTEGHPFKR